MKNNCPEYNTGSNFCDPETGICGNIADINELDQAANAGVTGTEIIYVGDPMCSWCWGMSPALIKLRNYFAPKGISYRIVVGGLRPGGGDRWDMNRKNRLRQTWQIVSEKSGQPFGFRLFDLDEFDYDTEPACRAVVAARPFIGGFEMEFFEEIQRKFYVDSHDPTQVEFYESICNKFELNYTDFKNRFEDEEVQEETFAEFDINREWGVQAYPAVLLSTDDKLSYVSQGYSTFENMHDKIIKFL